MDWKWGLVFVLLSGVAVAEDTVSAPGHIQSISKAETRVAGNGKALVRILAGPQHGGAHNAFFAVLELAPGALVPEHADATEEYIYVLEGGGQITVNGVEHSVTIGDSVFMPAKAVVSYKNGEADTKVLQVFAGPGPSAKYDTWTVQD